MMASLDKIVLNNDKQEAVNTATKGDVCYRTIVTSMRKGKQSSHAMRGDTGLAD